jgi:plasmid stabilization system protein ParE
VTHYTVELTEVAEIEVDGIYLYLSRRSPEAAHNWHAGLKAALAKLETFPTGYPSAREDTGYPNRTVRRLMYGHYRILFFVVEPGEETMGTVRVLHVRHGARNDI